MSRRWRWSLCVLGLVVVLLAAYIVFVPHGSYTAVATLQVQQEEPKLVLTTQENKTRFEVYQRTQNTLIKSRLVLDTVVKDPKVASLETIREAAQKDQGDPVDWLAKEVNVDFPPGSQILQIALSGEHPADLAVLVNAITDTYLRLVVDKAYNDRISRVETLRKLYGKYQEDMKTRREQIRRLALATGSDERRTLALKSQESQKKLQSLQDRIRGLDAQLSQLRIQQAALEAKIARRESLHFEDDPKLADMTDELAAVKAQQTFIPSEREKLLEETESLQAELQSNNVSVLDLKDEQDRIALLDATAKKIGAEVEAMEVELQAPKRVQVIDRAKVPKTRSFWPTGRWW